VVTAIAIYEIISQGMLQIWEALGNWRPALIKSAEILHRDILTVALQDIQEMVLNDFHGCQPH
jgi:hypothetical protein